MINILVCDDQKEWLDMSVGQITSLSKRYNIMTDIKAYQSIDSIPEEIIKNKEIDIAYLDIELGKGSNGIELAKKIYCYNKWVIIFFLTSHREFTKEAFFDIQAFGYLGKPIKENIFNNYFQKAVLQVSSIKSKQLDTIIEFFNEKIPIKVKQKDIFFIEKVNRKLNIKTMKKIYTASMTMRQIEEQLDSFFLKINQSVIVNMKNIALFSPSYKEVILKSGEIFTVSRTNKTNIKKHYESFIILHP